MIKQDMFKLFIPKQLRLCVFLALCCFAPPKQKFIAYSPLTIVQMQDLRISNNATPPVLEANSTPPVLEANIKLFMKTTEGLTFKPIMRLIKLNICEMQVTSIAYYDLKYANLEPLVLYVFGSAAGREAFKPLINTDGTFSEYIPSAINFSRQFLDAWKRSDEFPLKASEIADKTLEILQYFSVPDGKYRPSGSSSCEFSDLFSYWHYDAASNSPVSVKLDSNDICNDHNQRGAIGEAVMEMFMRFVNPKIDCLGGKCRAGADNGFDGVYKTGSGIVLVIDAKCYNSPKASKYNDNRSTKAAINSKELTDLRDEILTAYKLGKLRNLIFEVLNNGLIVTDFLKQATRDEIDKHLEDYLRLLLLRSPPVASPAASPSSDIEAKTEPKASPDASPSSDIEAKTEPKAVFAASPSSDMEAKTSPAASPSVSTQTELTAEYIDYLIACQQKDALTDSVAKRLFQ